jgi:tetratricopeptide (TPR) repeat protein
MRSLRALAIFAVAAPACAATWHVARSAHFEVFSDAAPDAARTLAASLERLHAFCVHQVGIAPRGTIRVIDFASPRDFDLYRIRPGATGYSLHTSDRDYIVVTANDLRAPAHEYTHLLIHNSGLTLPDWLSEGISEVMSAVRVGERYSFIGGDIPGRSGLLKSGRWLAPAELFTPSPKGASDPVRELMFYSQSWALAEMLIVSPRYAANFPALLAMLAHGSSSQAAIEGVYRTSIDAVFRELRERQARGLTAIPLPGIAEASDPVSLTPISAFNAQFMLADLRHAAGDSMLAEAMYRALALEQPNAPEIPAALGVIALERHDAAQAETYWRKALALGIEDAALCFRYATLADERGLPSEIVRAALDRAVALRPQFDEARFRLAHLDKNEGKAAAAVDHLRRMRLPAPDRAWAYYTTLADALLDLGRRDEAKQAAVEAMRHAASDADRARAAQLAWLAESEVRVEIAADQEGRRHFRTVRVPVKAPLRNPFIEAGDDARSIEATLKEVQCSAEGLRVAVSTAQGPLVLSVPDPSRVEIRNAGGVKFEFVCGPQKPRPVLVEYAAPSILRGLELK